MSRPRLDSLTGLRFFAAPAVFVHHTFAPGVVTGGLAQVPRAVHLADAGATGVTFFFVLSGFVLTWSWSDALPRWSFYGRRFARIYPLHFVFFLVAVLVVLPITHHKEPTAGAALANVLVIHTWFPNPRVFSTINAPSWSLSCEAAFYACLPFLLPRLRRATHRQRWAVVTCAVLVLALAPLALHAVAQGRYVLLSLWLFPPYRVCQFVLGVVLALAMKEGWRPRWSVTHATVATGLALIVGSRVLAYAGDNLALNARVFGQLYDDLVVLLPMAMLIAAVAAHDLAGRRSWIARPWWRALGDASFAFYLVHVPIILVMHARLGGGFVHLGRGIPFTLLVFLVCLGAAWLFHIGVERPIEARLRARLPVARSDKEAASPQLVA